MATGRQGKTPRRLAPKFLGDVASPASSPQPPVPCPLVWFHAVSVGEVNLLAPLLAAVERDRPSWQAYLTVGTVAGYELAVKKYPRTTVSYAPLDFSWAVRRALRIIRPDLLVLVELELWPNLIELTHRAGVPIAVINGRLSETSFRGYLRIRPLVRGSLTRLDRISAQTEDYAERFRALGAAVERVVVTGSLKFDGAALRSKRTGHRALARTLRLARRNAGLLGRQHRRAEEALAIETWNELRGEFPNLKLVVVPRHPERFAEVARLLTEAAVPFVTRSASRDDAPHATSYDAVLVDVIGELNAWWGLSTIGFVGGSLNDRGGQNMIEPAAYGVATCFGPNTRNFRDVVALLLAADATVVVADGPALTAFVRRCLRARTTRPPWVAARRTSSPRNTAQPFERSAFLMRRSNRTPISRRPEDREIGMTINVTCFAAITLDSHFQTTPQSATDIPPTACATRCWYQRVYVLHQSLRARPRLRKTKRRSCPQRRRNNLIPRSRWPRTWAARSHGQRLTTDNQRRYFD
ncbi:MAG: glycosyltransferase N-terminal domain-containing protein [Pirellulales bacterium]